MLDTLTTQFVSTDNAYKRLAIIGQLVAYYGDSLTRMIEDDMRVYSPNPLLRAAAKCAAHAY